MKTRTLGTTDPASAPYTVDALAARLGIGRVGVYEAIRRGEVPHIRIGRRIVLPREATDRWLARGRGNERSGADGQ